MTKKKINRITKIAYRQTIENYLRHFSYAQNKNVPKIFICQRIMIYEFYEIAL